MRAKRHLSPWREMGFVAGDDARVRHARDFTFLCCALGISAWGLVAVLRRGVSWSSAAPQFAHWWSPLLGVLLTVLYGVAGWGIGRRDPRAAVLALALFGWRILGAVLGGHLLSITAVIGLLGIGLVLRAGQPLGLRSVRTVAP